MKDLIARLEAAEVGSRELDLRVFERFDLVDGERWTDADLEYALTDPNRTINPPHLTTSLDSALALAERVLPGWKMHALQDQDGMYQHDNSARRWCCGLSEKRGPGNELSYSPTPALALCIAILRAKQIDTASNPR